METSVIQTSAHSSVLRPKFEKVSSRIEVRTVTSAAEPFPLTNDIA